LLIQRSNGVGILQVKKMIGFYELIAKIKKRPALYLGNKSISHLQVFLDGYTFARRELKVPISNEEADFEDFQEWIEGKFNLPDTQSWAKIILFYSADERDALERFFELFDEFVKRNSSSTTEEVKEKSVVSK